MTEKEAQNQICNNNLLLSQLLRVDKTNNVNNVPSFLKKIAEATKTQCKKWVNSAEYKEGDIISLDSISYICKIDNINKNPLLFKTYWIKIILPYSSNKGKVKAYISYQVNADLTITILNSYNIDYITAVGGTLAASQEIKLNSIVNNKRQLAFFGFFTNNQNKLGIISSVLKSTSDYKIYTINLKYKGGGSILGTHGIINHIVFYNTDTVITPI